MFHHFAIETLLEPNRAIYFLALQTSKGSRNIFHQKLLLFVNRVRLFCGPSLMTDWINYFINNFGYYKQQVVENIAEKNQLLFLGQFFFNLLLQFRHGSSRFSIKIPLIQKETHECLIRILMLRTLTALAELMAALRAGPAGMMLSDKQLHVEKRIKSTVSNTHKNTTDPPKKMISSHRSGTVHLQGDRALRKFTSIYLQDLFCFLTHIPIKPIVHTIVLRMHIYTEAHLVLRIEGNSFRMYLLTTSILLCS